MEHTIKVSCLPVAGIENPYQTLMMKGLRTDKRLLVKSGIPDRFFGIIRTAIIQKPDYIHFDWETSFYYRRSLWLTMISIPIFMLQIYMAKYILKCKLVWTPHNLTPHDLRHIDIHKFCRQFFAKNMLWIRLFSHKSLDAAVTEFKCPSTKFKIIPEGSYVDYYPNNINRSDARIRLSIGEDTRVILYLGLIKPYKGIANLIDAFNSSRNENELLIIAGKIMDKGYGEHIKKSVKENIILIDQFIKADELQFYFNAADVVVLPFNKIENSGSAILAMGFKKPVIAPRLGVLTERLQGQPELLYINSLKDSFESFKRLSNEHLRQIGEKNFHALSYFNWSDFAKAF